MNNILNKIFTDDKNLNENEIKKVLLEMNQKDFSKDLADFAKFMKQKATPVKLSSNKGFIDVCGTGGDCLGTFNISTTVAFVIAGIGVKVIKHGNRSVSSKSGSADVLEKLEVPIEIPCEKLQKVLDKTNMVFLYAPYYHPCMEKIKQIRKSIGIPTIFNLLGPLVNPVNLDYQVIGVYDKTKCEIVAKALLKSSIKEAMVVYGADGLDELSTTGENLIFHIKNKKLTKQYLTPEEVGLKRAELKDLLGGDSEENAQITIKILKGELGAKRDIVLLNSAAALVTSGVAKDFKDGIEKAKESIDSGKAISVLEKLKNVFG